MSEFRFATPEEREAGTAVLVKAATVLQEQFPDLPFILVTAGLGLASNLADRSLIPSTLRLAANHAENLTVPYEPLPETKVVS